MNLITLQEFKDFRGITSPKEDSKISMLIDMVSALIQTYLDIDLEGGKEVTQTILLDYDTNVIYLDDYPISSVVSVSESDRYTWDSSIHVPLAYASDFVVNAAEGTITRVYTPGGFANWPLSPGIVTVHYTTAPKWESMSGTDAIPKDLKLAAIELVSYYKDDEFRQSKTIQGTSIVNTLAQGADFPKHIQVILDKYK